MQAVKQAVKIETTQQRPAGARMALLILLSFIKIGAFTFGSGWSFLFRDSRGEELRWEIPGEGTQTNKQTKKLTIFGDLSETTLIRIQIR